MSFQNESAKQESSPIATVSEFNPSSDVKFTKPKVNKIWRKKCRCSKQQDTKSSTAQYSTDPYMGCTRK